jgi:ABC-type multidrug transport system fused ATPase/permease subunit
MKSVANSSMPDLLLRMWRHLRQRRRRQFFSLMGLMLVSALAEVVSLGAVVPFLGILTTPQRVFDQPAVAAFARAWGITSAEQLVLPLTVAFAAIALVAGLLRVTVLWITTRFAHSTGSQLSIEVYRRTLYQPYWVHAARNSSEVISGITNKVGGAILVLNQLLILISATFMLVTVTLALIAIDPVVALMATGAFGVCYFLIAGFSRRKLRRNSRRIAHEQTQVVKALQEGLGGIRDVLLDGTQPAYCDIYRQADQPLRRAQGNNDFIGMAPRYLMEATGMILIAALAYGLSRQSGGISAAIPVLGALALGAQRLLPALQQAYGAWTTMASAQASLATTIQLLDQPLPAELFLPLPQPLDFTTAIRFDAMRFRYTEDGPWVVDELDVTIPKGARIGIVGRTGSGKSTLLDLLMGLLLPTSGRLVVDGEPMTVSRIRAWQRTIAHVPQSIYLADTSLAENIAFGVPRIAIDMESVRRAARQAQIADFIEGRPEGYETIAGERGVRLSGGQRQRIGIARALYKRAMVLVFDEATSALDNATEKSVMDAIDGLDRELTIVLIAHRLSTVQRCDTIIEMENGRVVAQGSYEQLLSSSHSFRRMAHAE